MAGPAVARPLLSAAAAAAVVGAASADVALDEHPTHLVVLGVVAVVVAALSRGLGAGPVATSRAVTGALAGQPILHLAAELARPAVGPHDHRANPLPHVLADAAAPAGVQIAVPALALAAVTIATRLVWLVVETIRRPLASTPVPPSAAPVPLVRARSGPAGSVLRWCGWAIHAARRGPPPRPAAALS